MLANRVGQARLQVPAMFNISRAGSTGSMKLIDPRNWKNFETRPKIFAGSRLLRMIPAQALKRCRKLRTCMRIRNYSRRRHLEDRAGLCDYRHSGWYEEVPCDGAKRPLASRFLKKDSECFEYLHDRKIFNDINSCPFVLSARRRTPRGFFKQPVVVVFARNEHEERSAMCELFLTSA